MEILSLNHLNQLFLGEAIDGRVEIKIFDPYQKSKPTINVQFSPLILDLFIAELSKLSAEAKEQDAS